MSKIGSVQAAEAVWAPAGWISWQFVSNALERAKVVPFRLGRQEAFSSIVNEVTCLSPPERSASLLLKVEKGVGLFSDQLVNEILSPEKVSWPH